MSVLETTHSAGDGAADGSEEAVKVFVRIRPLNKRELAENQTIGWDFNETSMLEDTANGQRVYAYDHCFGPAGTNQETYDIVGKPVVLKAMEGYNGTVFTYGQTGSGKTWTMRGCPSDPGMMILCIRDILDYIRTHPQNAFTLRVSYLEVYNEEINDLLGEVGSSNSKNLKIVSEDAARGAVIGGLVEEQAQTAEDFMAILHRGEASRSYASTEMNNESSRSHTIYRVAIDIKDLSPDGSGSTVGAGKVSYLNLVDLAGSERQKSTKAEGKTLKEGANINKSLLALGAVINKLGDNSKKSKGKAAFIPYRDSKLTRILKQSLGGNTLTSILCAVTPAPMHREETVSTLKFGQLCKSIKNNVKSNDGAMDDKTLIRQYRNTINEMRAQLEQFQKAGAVASADPESALGQALKEKGELELKLRSLESGGAVAGDGDGSGVHLAATSELVDEVARLSKELAEQKSLVSVLQCSLDEFHDLEEQKAAFEEYEQHCRQELEEDNTRLETEKQQLQNERYKLLKDRGIVDEKELRVGGLITQLDEKESKLRQSMATIKEQQEQWQRSVTDLQRREDLVDDWQANHQQLEQGLRDRETAQQAKQNELSDRESQLAAREAHCKSNLQSLEERAQRLSIAETRVATAEEAFAAREERLKAAEQALQKREIDSDMRDRELQSRRKEMESWDVLLREKDRKIILEQQKLDERERTVLSVEDKVRQRDVESERRATELRQSEQRVAEQQERYSELLEEVQQRDTDTQEQMRESTKLAEELATKEKTLAEWERKLKKLQDRLTGIEQREAQLNERVAQHQRTEDEFFNVQVAQITARHSKELLNRDSMVNEQLQITSDFQKELEACREELSQRDVQIEYLEDVLEQKNNLIENLKEQMTLSDQESMYSMDSADGVSNNQSDEEGELHPHLPTRRQGIVAYSSGNSQRSSSPYPAATSAATGAMNNSGSGNSVGDHNQHNVHHENHQHPHQHQHQHLLHHSGGSGGHHGTYGGAALNLPPEQQFLLQLATTQRVLYNVLAKHNAVPDQSGPRPRRTQYPYPMREPHDAVEGAPTAAADVSHAGGATSNSGVAMAGQRRGSSTLASSDVDAYESGYQHANTDAAMFPSHLPFRRVSSASAPDLSSTPGFGNIHGGSGSGNGGGNSPAKPLHPMRRPSVPLIAGDMSPDVISTRRMSLLMMSDSIDDLAEAANSAAEEKAGNSSGSSTINGNGGNSPDGRQGPQLAGVDARYARETASSSAQRQQQQIKQQQLLDQLQQHHQQQQEEEQQQQRKQQFPQQQRRRAPPASSWGHHSISTITNTPLRSPLSGRKIASASPSSQQRHRMRVTGSNGGSIGIDTSSNSPQRSPQLQNLVQSGKRNGIPVTTVNLGMSGGMRRAAAAAAATVGSSDFASSLLASASLSPDNQTNAARNRSSGTSPRTPNPNRANAALSR